MTTPLTRRIAYPLLLLVFAGGAATAGQPYTPAAPGDIVARLPRTLAQPPRGDETAATDGSAVGRARGEASNYVVLAQRSGDARYLGYALAALTPWLDAPEPPFELLLPLALIQQARHDFAKALRTLDRITARDPGNAQAWLTRAVIQQVQGDPAAARHSCQRVRQVVSPLTTATCITGAERLGDGSRRAYRWLQRALDDATEWDRAILPWSLTVLAELAELSGDPDAARDALRQAMELDSEDIRPRIAYADLMLRRAEPRAVLDLIAADTPEPMLLLRRALAATALALPEAAEYAARLDEYFAASALRGDELHEREAALANLALFGRPQRALQLAQKNWEKQREFADTQLLLSTAVAAHDRPAAERVVRWLAGHRNADVRLAALLQTCREQVDGDAY